MLKGFCGVSAGTLFGGLRKAKDFDAVCAKEIWIKTRRRRLRVATDGEVTVMNTPLYYRVLPAALRVIVPRTDQEGIVKE